MNEITQPKRRRNTAAATAASAAIRRKQADNRNCGKELDQELFPLIEALLAHAGNNYSGDDLTNVRLFIDMAKELHRGINFRKQSIQTFGREQIRREVDPELDQPFEETKYLFFVDGWVSEMVRLARSVHLSLELTKFWVETLEKATKWFQANPENLEWQDEIAAELERRRRGEDTYQDPNRRLVGRPRKSPDTLPSNDYALVWI